MTLQDKAVLMAVGISVTEGPSVSIVVFTAGSLGDLTVEWKWQVTKSAWLQILDTQVFNVTSRGTLGWFFFMLGTEENIKYTTHKPLLPSTDHHHCFIAHSFTNNKCLRFFFFWQRSFFPLSYFSSLAHILATLPYWNALLGYYHLIPSWKPSWFLKWTNFA